MDFFKVLTSNAIINICFLAWASAQLIKTFLYWVVTNRFRSERLLGSGGMPSSHTATVASLCIALARREGFDSPMFALSIVFAAIVMYDALGVRRAAGEQAKVLNQMRFDFTNMHDFFLGMVSGDQDSLEVSEPVQMESDSDTTEKSKQKPVFDGEKLLKEFLGHTPIEVLAGAALGICIGLFYPL